MLKIARLLLTLHNSQDQQDYKWYRVAISINSLPLHRGSINERKLSLAIYVQGKNISRKSCIHENILP